MDETDFHLFFACHFVHEVWFSSPLGLRVDGLLQQGIDQVENALHHIMTTYNNDNSVATIFNILWSIWKARNVLLFNKENNNPLQVLHAAKALLYTGDLEHCHIGGCATTQTPATLNSTSLVALDRSRISKRPNIYTDAAWKKILWLPLLYLQVLKVKQDLVSSCTGLVMEALVPFLLKPPPWLVLLCRWKLKLSSLRLKYVLL